MVSSAAERESLAAAKEATLSEEISALKRSIKTIQSELDEQARISAESAKTAEELTTANMGKFRLAAVSSVSNLNFLRLCEYGMLLASGEASQTRIQIFICLLLQI